MKHPFPEPENKRPQLHLVAGTGEHSPYGHPYYHPSSNSSKITRKSWFFQSAAGQANISQPWSFPPRAFLTPCSASCIFLVHFVLYPRAPVPTTLDPLSLGSSCFSERKRVCWEKKVRKLFRGPSAKAEPKGQEGHNWFGRASGFCNRKEP